MTAKPKQVPGKKMSVPRLNGCNHLDDDSRTPSVVHNLEGKRKQTLRIRQLRNTVRAAYDFTFIAGLTGQAGEDLCRTNLGCSKTKDWWSFQRYSDSCPEYSEAWASFSHFIHKGIPETDTTRDPNGFPMEKPADHRR